MTQKISLKDSWPIIEEKLKAGADVTINPGGVSMKPLVIPGRDSVILTALPEKINKYDVVLFIRQNGQFVLHRVVGFCDDGFIMCGDNEYYWERGIKREQIIALMKGVIRKNKTIYLNTFSCKLYSRVWVRLQRIGYYLRAIKNKIFKRK